MIVVGAGTSGMVVTASTTGQGVRVFLVGRNKKAGKELLITGDDWCNVMNNHLVDDLIAHIPGNGRLLYSTSA